MHLEKLGFNHVYNECEDFYAAAKAGTCPPHDVVVTNPPYSEGHVAKLLDFCVANAAPFMLLVPDHVGATKKYVLVERSDVCIIHLVYPFIVSSLPYLHLHTPAIHVYTPYVHTDHTDHTSKHPINTQNTPSKRP